MMAVPSMAPIRMRRASRGRRLALRTAKRRSTGLATSITRNGSERMRTTGTGGLRLPELFVGDDHTVVHDDLALGAGPDVVVVGDEDQREPIAVQLVEQVHDLA